MKHLIAVILLVLLIAQASALALSRHEATCLQNCPAGWFDTGNGCNPDYGRNAFALWQKNQCDAAYGAGNCEKFGAMYYPKCKAGYSPYGCCICRNQNNADCAANGLGPWTGNLRICAKKSTC